MPKFDTIKPGDILYDVHSYRMGNTKMRAQGCWEVRVIEVDAERRRALVSWNGNTPDWRPWFKLEKYRRSRPKRKEQPMTTPKHTPEPWMVRDERSSLRIVGGVENRTWIATMTGSVSDPESMADASRIIACVNACAGMEDPAAEIARLRAELAEATAALLNERGEGEPPGEGWTVRIDRDRGVLWTMPNGRGDTLEVSQASQNGVRGHIPMWRVTGLLGGPNGVPMSQTGPFQTARSAMRAASEALTPKEP